MSPDRPDVEIALHVSEIDQVVALLDLYKRYQIKDVSIQFRSDVRGAQLQPSDACVCLRCSPISYEDEYVDCTETDCLRTKGFYRECVVHRDVTMNHKTLIVNGSTANARGNPWMSDTSILQYGFFFKSGNQSPDYQQLVKRVG
ncbi:hypothetical protein EG68_04983 [Paragonimus skrjabini miyazakii]|uniref:Uncharacterized protein n=1 Tax=Paragonimus skrjabini miyazakii TaxID=59628 RepID=A0A8S9YV07_9TREM|nr:hypothetical protein EG68_04983 [Paragonimus skrjabini miyazakii]